MKKRGPEIEIELKRVGEQLVSYRVTLDGWDKYCLTVTEAQLIFIHKCIGDWATRKAQEKETANWRAEIADRT